MLVWSYPDRSFKICDDKYSKVLTLERGDEGGIFFSANEDVFEIHPEDVASITFFEPKLLREGFISFYDDNNEILEYIVDGRKIACTLAVSKKQKDTFYLMFSILKDNGFIVEAY